MSEAATTTPAATPAPGTVTPPVTPPVTPAPGTTIPPKEPTVVRKGAGQADDDPAQRQMIPRSRLREETQKLTAANKELEELKPKAERATQLETQLGSLQAQLAFARVGVLDEEHVDAVSAAFAKLPEEGRPASAVEYWQKIAAGELEAPRGLKGFLSTGTGAGGAGTPPARPRLPAATADATPAGPAVTADQLTAAQMAVRNDPSEANRKRLTELTSAYQASLNARGAKA